MSFDTERKQFYKTNDIQLYEHQYAQDSSSNCQEIIQTYTSSCDQTRFVADIKQFFDSHWYDTYKNKISEISDYETLRDMQVELKRFKRLMKIPETDDIRYVIPDVEKRLVECIQSRIEYKYKCIRPEDRDRKHDMEILRQIFHRMRFAELKQLFTRIINRYIEIKTQKAEARRREEEFELEFLKTIGSNTSSDSFEPVVKRNKRSRPTRH